ncbi:MAG: hypothetical protein WBK91_09640 [Alphaproteobacteria bacterium]
MRRQDGFFESKRDVALFAALLGLGGVMLTRYLGAERTFYFWDHSMYPGWAFAFFAALKADAVTAWVQFAAALNDDYNWIYTLPEMAFFALFGASRLTYTLANFVVYGGGLALAVGAMAARLGGWRFWRAATLALAALLMLPFVWIPLVDAYPDLGGTALLAAVLVIFLRRWPEVDWRGWVLAGALLALAILFRRHFIYPAAAVLAAAGAVQFFWRSGLYAACSQVGGAGISANAGAIGGGWRWALLRTAAGVGTAVVVCTGVLFLAAPEFIRRLLLLDYPQLYASYAEAASGLVDRQFLVIGPLNLFSAAAGYALAWRARAEIRAHLALLLLLGVLWCVLWFGFVRFGGKHYLLQILPILLPVGWLLLGRELWGGGRLRRRLAGILGTVLLLQAALCFWFGDILISGNGTRAALPGIFAQTRPPLVRQDVPELQKLVDYLHATGGADDRIAVLASSHLFNQDLLAAVDQARADKGALAGARLPIVAMPEVDRRDALPLDAIAQANILVVATPPQYHLLPEGQRVIGSVLALLAAPGAFAEAWQGDDRKFMLEHGVQVMVLRLKQRWTPEGRAAMLRVLRAQAAVSGSSPQDWVMTRADFGGRITTDAQNRTAIFGAALPQADAKPFTAFFMIPIPAHEYRLVGKISMAPECRIMLRFRLLDGAGKVLQDVPVVAPTGGMFESLLTPTAATGYLQLEATASADAKLTRCPFTIEGLQVVRR